MYHFKTLLVFLPIIFLPSLWVIFFLFLFTIVPHLWPPSLLRFQSFLWSPIDIVNDLLLVFDTVSLIYLFFVILTSDHPIFLDLRALFRCPPTSPPLVACIWYSNNRKLLIFDTMSFNIACVWYSKFDTVPPLLVFICQVLEQSCLQIAIILHLNGTNDLKLVSPELLNPTQSHQVWQLTSC